MANIQEKIAKLFPEATFEEGECLLVNIPDAKWHALAKTLKEDSELSYDYLVAIVGVDWTETLGCMYYLTSTKYNTHISVRVSTADREKPMLHSITDLWAVANLYEREVYDYFGIIFINHPDMRRLFLRNDWVGYPLRKDYDASPEVNPVRLDHEEVEDTSVTYVEEADGTIVKKDVTIFAPEDFVVNIGPQHPATHGVLRFRTAVDGETIKKIDLYLGYIHRGIEKLCEGLGYPQTLHFTDRLDYLSAQQNRHCLCLCIEKALGIEVPRRAQVIRVMMDELMRISSHLLFIGTFCMDLGATTMLFYAMRERERVLDIFERTCGARMTFNYNCIGGIMDDLDAGFVDDVKALIEIMPKCLKEYDTIFTGNVIAHNRMDGVGVLSREDAYPIRLPVLPAVLRVGPAMCARPLPTAYIPNLTSRRLCSTRVTRWLASRLVLRRSVSRFASLSSLLTKSPKAKYVQRFPRLSSCPPDTGSSRWRQVVAHSVSTSRAPAAPAPCA